MKAKPCLDTVKKSQTILALPDGTLSETYQITRLCLSAAVCAHNLSFIIRLHPILPKSKIERYLKSLSSGRLPHNLRFSSDDLDTDISNAQWCLYRSSSTVFNAAAQMVIPFFVGTEDERTIDPLLILDLGSHIPPSLTCHIQLLDLISHSKFQLGDSWLAKRCQSYYHPFEPLQLLQCLGLNV